MALLTANPSPYASTRNFSSAIAEEALGLLAAFLAKDREEMKFRATLLLAYADDTGQKALASSSLALLDKVPDGDVDKLRLTTLVEHVIAAAADIVTAGATSPRFE